MYRVETLSQSTKDMFNFYLQKEDGNELLMCSVYTRYMSRAKGVKKAGDIVREVYGDFQIYSDYESIRYRAVNKAKKDFKDSRNMKLVDPDLNRFVDVIEKRGEMFYHKLVYFEGQVVEEIVQNKNESGGMIESLSMKMVEEGRKVQVRKIKDIDYVVRISDQKTKDLGLINIQSLDYISMQKDIAWMHERKYKIVDDEEKLREYVDLIKRTKTVIGFDTETTGLNINRFDFDHPSRDNLVGFCISVEDMEGIYIPIRQLKFNNIEEQVVIDLLQPYFDEKGEDPKNLVTHYGSFDWKVMYGYGWNLHITDDTYILQYLLDVNAQKGLSTMAEGILGLEMIDLKDFFPGARGGSKSDIQFSMLPYESVRHYGPVDSDVTRELYYKLRPLLPNDMKFIYGVEIDLMKRLGKSEYYGIKIDIQKTMELAEEAREDKDILEQEIYELAGEEFNINSGDQLERILFDKMRYPSHGTTATGKRSTGKDVLKILSKDKDKEGNLLYPLASKISNYKKVEKLLNSFLEKILRENVDGYLFPHYNQAGTKSGRISGNNPNLQQTSGAIRELFIPDSDDYYFLIVDYSQVEYRVMAGLSDEYEVIDYFSNNPEADYHVLMYARMTGKNPEEVTSSERSEGKTLNFGISYGMSPPSLALSLYGSNTKEQTKDAEDKIRDYFDSVPNIRDYLVGIKDGAQLRGYVKTLFNRKRIIPEFEKEDPEYYEIERGKRKAGNTVVQGTAADIMKFAHVRVENSLEKDGYDARAIASIHDELVLLVNKKHNPWEMIDLVRRSMEIDLSNYNFPPLYIGANVGDTWGDGGKDNYEAPVLLMNRRREELAKGMHKEPMENPADEMASELLLFALEQVRVEIEKSGVKTLEEAWHIPRLAKYAGSYLGTNADFAIQGLLVGESEELIQSQLDRVDVLGEDYYTTIEDSIEGVEGVSGEDEDETRINYSKMQNYYEDNKDNLLLVSPEIKKASEVYSKDYSVIGFDRKLIVKLNKPTVGMMKELVNYFESVDVKKGYAVHFQLGNKLKATKFHTSRIDRLAIIDIIEESLRKREVV